MRILIANWHKQVVGGAETYLRTLIPELVKRGHQLAIVHGYRPTTQREAIDSPEYGLPSWCFEELGIASLLEKIKRWLPDVVYSQGLESVELDSALLDAYPAAIFEHNYYGTCATGAKCHARPSRKPCARKLGAACLVLHYPLGCGGLSPITAWSNYRDQLRRNLVLRRFPAVLVASEHMRQEVTRNGVCPDRVHLAPLAPTSLRPLSDPPARKDPGGTILLSGRLTKVKGGEYLINALPDAGRRLGRALHLIVAGTGAEEQRLREAASRRGVSAEFMGWIEGEQHAEGLRSCDLLAFPSVWPEPFGLSGIEAGGFGIPAVGYAAGAVPEWLIAGYSGELAPADPPTSAGLAQAIAKALADPEHYNRLRTGAWEVSRRYNWRQHLEKLETVLQAIIHDSSCSFSTSAHESHSL